MKKSITSLIFGMLLLAAFSCSEVQTEEAVPATDEVTFRQPESYPWRDHAPPFDFLFGNHIDTHQQTNEVGNGQLQGFFYIRFTGEYTEDGVPIATHGNCGMPMVDCTVGWTWHGIPVEATLVAHEAGQHPTWCIDPADMPNQPGYSHFHWTGSPRDAHGLGMGAPRSGYLLKLTARETFYFEHHGGYLVTPGIDDETHYNIEVGCD